MTDWKILLCSTISVLLQGWQPKTVGVDLCGCICVDAEFPTSLWVSHFQPQGWKRDRMGEREGNLRKSWSLGDWIASAVIALCQLRSLYSVQHPICVWACYLLYSCRLVSQELLGLIKAILALNNPVSPSGIQLTGGGESGTRRCCSPHASLSWLGCLFRTPVELIKVAL